MEALAKLAHLQTAAEQSKGLIAQVAGSTAGALEELEEGKADRLPLQAAMLAASGWAENPGGPSGAGYPYAYDLPMPQATGADGAETIIGVDSFQTANACGLGSITDVLDGCIRYYAAQQPTGDIQAQVRLIQGGTTQR